MRKTLTFEIAEEVYSALQDMAAKTGRSLDELALEWLKKYRPKPRPALNDEDRPGIRVVSKGSSRRFLFRPER